MTPHIFAGGIDTRSGTGLAIPDEESYYLWQDFYDAVIDARHNHPPGVIHETDLDYTKIDPSKLPATRRMRQSFVLPNQGEKKSPERSDSGNSCR